MCSLYTILCTVEFTRINPQHWSNRVMDTPVHHPSVQINYFFSHSRRFLDIFVANYSGNHQSTILSKGNQVPYLEFERPNGKISESKKFLTSVKNWCVQLTWKLNEAISSKIWLESKQIKRNESVIFNLWICVCQRKAGPLKPFLSQVCSSMKYFRCIFVNSAVQFYICMYKKTFSRQKKADIFLELTIAFC